MCASSLCTHTWEENRRCAAVFICYPKGMRDLWLRSAVVLFCLLSTPFAFLRADDSITAPELARHLGVYSWRIPRDKLPPYYQVSLQRVQEGHLIGREFLGGGFKNNGDLLICARKADGSIQVSLDDDTMSMCTKVPEIPEFPVFLDHCQFGEVGVPFLLIAAQEVPKAPPGKIRVAGHFFVPRDYTKAKDGFAMTITRNSTWDSLPDSKQKK